MYTRKWVDLFLFPFLFCEIVENELLNPHIFQHVVGKHIRMNCRRKTIGPTSKIVKSNFTAAYMVAEVGGAFGTLTQP